MNDTFRSSDTSWVLTKTDLSWMLHAIEEAGYGDLDLETTGLDEYAVRGGASNGGVAAEIALLSLTLDTGTTWKVPLAHPESPWTGRWRQVLRLIAKRLRRVGLPLSGHHFKFDVRWITAHTGISLARQIEWDTEVSSHLLDENESTRLKARAPQTFDIPPWDDFDLSYPGAVHDVPLIDLGEYAARDTYWTQKLRENHQWVLNLRDSEEPVGREEVEMHRLGLLATWVTMPTVRTLAAIEERGMGLDVPWVRQALREHEEEAQALFQHLSSLYPDVEGTPSFAPTSLYFQGWTQAAVDAGDLRVTDLTGTGKPSWGASVLQRQANGGSELAQALLDYRGFDKRAQFLRAWLGKVSPKGRIHSTYRVGSVVTGRLCVSADTLIDMPRDMVKYPEGVPITEVRAGDWVYAFDHRRELTLRQVKWVGQTGVKRTVVVTLRNSHGHERTLRCTPDHLVRLRSGDYRHAEKLRPGDRVMPMVRRGFYADDKNGGGYFTFFPHSIARGNGQRGGGKNKEHRWVAERMFGKRVSTKIDVHHDNGTKTDNTPSNLMLLTMSEHRALGRGHARYGESREVPSTYCGPNDYRVVSVESGEVEPVWDMEVLEDHCFVANGIVVHNSSSDPNIQQVTRSLRPAFIPSEGNYIVELDYSQIELRVAAFISRSEPMLTAFQEGQDLHTLLASQITGKAAQDVRPHERQAGKCFHPDTEVLTPSGWKRIIDLAPGEQVMQGVPGEHLRVGLEWATPYQVYTMPNEHDHLIHLSNEGIDLRVTPDHAMLAYNAYDGWVECLPEELPKKRGWKNAGHFQGDWTVDETLLRIAVMVQADANVEPSGRFRIGLSKDRKIDRCVALLDAAGIPYRRSVRSNGRYVPTTVIAFHSSEVASLLDADKTLPWSWLRLTEGLREVVLEEAVFWDGHRRENWRMGQYMSGVQKNRDVMQALASVTGRKSRDDTRMKLTIRGLGSDGSRGGNVEVTREPYTGTVTCLAVPSGIVLVRDGGVPMIVKNSANFGLLYGMGVDGFRNYADTVYGVSFTVEEAHTVHQTFFDTWEGIRDWHDRSIMTVNRTGQVVSPIGRIRRLPGIWGHNPGDAERAAINSPVQGFASDMMQVAAATIEGMLPGYEPVEGAALIGTVHDSIILEVRQDGWEEIVAECQRRMTEEVVTVLRDRLNCTLDVPLVADATVSTRWGLGDIAGG